MLMVNSQVKNVGRLQVIYLMDVLKILEILIKNAIATLQVIGKLLILLMELVFVFKIILLTGGLLLLQPQLVFVILT